MAAMETDEKRSRRGSRLALVLAGTGLAAALAGFIGGRGAEGDIATGWGVLAGVGFATAVVGAVKIWLDQRIEQDANDPGGALRRERLQIDRSRQLWIYPLLAVAFLVQATSAMGDILEGTGRFSDYLQALLPVLYAWLIVVITLGWDGHTKKNRRWLEDELTLVIRARAMTAAAVVLMAGLTIAFGLALWRTEIGVLALLFTLTAGGVTAGIRFAWLDREAGKDG